MVDDPVDQHVVVTDQRDDGAVVTAQGVECVEQVLVSGRVERGGDFVAHEDGWTRHEPAGDGGALELTTRQRARAARRDRAVHARPFEWFRGVGQRAGQGLDAQQYRGPGDLFDDGAARAERRTWVLVDVLDGAALRAAAPPDPDETQRAVDADSALHAALHQPATNLPNVVLPAPDGPGTPR